MSKSINKLKRRAFLKKSAIGTAVAMAPTIIPASALGRDGTTPPSERIVLGGIELEIVASMILDVF